MSDVTKSAEDALAVSRQVVLTDAEIALLTDEELARYAADLEVASKHLDGTFLPFPRQLKALELLTGANGLPPVDELLFGGSLGGGKSVLSCHYAISVAERFSGSRSLIIRRAFPSLARTVIPTLAGILGNTKRATWSEGKKTWTFPNTSVIELGSAMARVELNRYAGPSYVLVLVEEAGEFPQDYVDFLRTRLRTTIVGAHPQLLLTANPVGPGLPWLRNNFVAPKLADLPPEAEVSVERFHGPPGANGIRRYSPWVAIAADVRPSDRAWVRPEIPWRARTKQGATIKPPSRVFVPSKLSDNFALVKADPDYAGRIEASGDDRMVRALRDGDWTAMDEASGTMWQVASLEATRVHAAPRLMEIVVAIDPAGGPKGDVVGLVAGGIDFRDPPHFYVLEDRSAQMGANDWPAAAVDLYDDLAADRIVVETNFGGDQAVVLIHNIRPDIVVEVVRATRGKDVRAEPVANLWRLREEDGGPRGHIVGALPELEGEITTWTKGADWSPGRLDALVWAGTYLTGASAGGVAQSNIDSLRQPPGTPATPLPVEEGDAAPVIPLAGYRLSRIGRLNAAAQGRGGRGRKLGGRIAGGR